MSSEYLHIQNLPGDLKAKYTSQCQHRDRLRDKESLMLSASTLCISETLRTVSNPISQDAMH
jgi:hypothetical protein